ncbi:MAG TPA: cation:dicarboxylase symporter family transporter [Allosphingosinicella sp.]|nr:cation:dicarboxylase symporter family transporter [Allosphingosinicella sp.]
MKLSQPTRILLALILGLAIGIVAMSTGQPWTERAAGIAEPIGGLWLNALQMTIVPLVVSLIITGIAGAAEAARASRLATRALILFASLLLASSILAAILTPALLNLFPLPTDAAASLQSALAGAEPPGATPSFADFLRSLVPSNPIAAASSNGGVLPLIVFMLVFAFAMTRLEEKPRATLVRFFKAIADTMLIIVNWVLWIGPIGVFALAFVVGARAGGPAFQALIHYVLIVTAVGAVVWLAAWPLAMLGGRVGPVRFTRAVASSQALAFSTQSSLACLPAMLKATHKLGVPVSASGIVLPMAVAVFRATGPAMNLAVAIYIAYWFGYELTPTHLVLGVLAAATTTIGAAGIPGQATFFTSIAPICLAMGLPIAPLALLIAVETLPDIMRTLGNVSGDVAVTTVVAKRSGFDDAPETREDELLERGA